MEITSLLHLKEHNRKAHTALIKFWALLSRVSDSSARRYLKEDIGYRYKITQGEQLVFEDTEAGDSYVFNGEDWS